MRDFCYWRRNSSARERRAGDPAEAHLARLGIEGIPPQSKIASWSGSKTRDILFFFRSNSRSFQKHLYSGTTPRCISDGQMQIERVSSGMRVSERSRGFACASRTLSRISFILRLRRAQDASVSPTMSLRFRFEIHSRFGSVIVSPRLCRKRILWSRTHTDICLRDA